MSPFLANLMNPFFTKIPKWYMRYHNLEGKGSCLDSADEVTVTLIGLEPLNFLRFNKTSIVHTEFKPVDIQDPKAIPVHSMDIVNYSIKPNIQILTDGKYYVHYETTYVEHPWWERTPPPIKSILLKRDHRDVRINSKEAVDCIKQYSQTLET